ECHDLRDMYFYITRGLELMAEGERQNRHNPEMRYAIGLYAQHKVCQSDKTSTMRSMLQLSCVDPAERAPSRFQVTSPDGKVLSLDQAEQYCQQQRDYCRRHPEDREAKGQLEETQRNLETARRNFEDFCRKHPQLVRRLHDGLRTRIGERLAF